MGYEAMSARELQEELARRGLPSARASKAVLTQRLLDDDAGGAVTGGGPAAGPGGSADVPAVLGDGEYVVTTAAPHTAPVLPPGIFRLDFPAEPGGPDEETHLAYRAATIQAAAAAGHTPRGDARLAATTDGRWVYEVSIRRRS